MQAALVAGAGFGIAVYFFMQKIVLPLSQVSMREPDATGLAVGIAIHIIAIGMPMALVARRLLAESQ